MKSIGIEKYTGNLDLELNDWQVFYYEPDILVVGKVSWDKKNTLQVLELKTYSNLDKLNNDAYQIDTVKKSGNNLEMTLKTLSPIPLGEIVVDHYNKKTYNLNISKGKIITFIVDKSNKDLVEKGHSKLMGV